MPLMTLRSLFPMDLQTNHGFTDQIAVWCEYVTCHRQPHDHYFPWTHGPTADSLIKSKSGVDMSHATNNLRSLFPMDLQTNHGFADQFPVWCGYVASGRSGHQQPAITISDGPMNQPQSGVDTMHAAAIAGSRSDHQ